MQLDLHSQYLRLIVVIRERRARRAHSRPTRARNSERSEGGDTLIEVLIAIVVIAIGVVALLGALTTSITSSATYRSLATIDTVLKDFAEAVKYDVQQVPTASSLYTNCATSYQVVNEYPTSTVAGGGVTVLGTGFTPYQTVQVMVNGVPMVVQSGQTVEPNQSVVATFTLPTNSTPGPQVIALSDGGPFITSVTPLTVNPSLSSLTPTSGPDGAQVSVTAAGFIGGASLAVSVGGIAVTPSPSTADANGNAIITFDIPNSLPEVPPTPETVVVSDGTYTSTTTIIVASSTGPAGPAFTPPASAISNYTIGLSVSWWNGSIFQSAPTPCGSSDETGIQLVTVQATASNNVTDTLSFVVTDPVYRPGITVNTGAVPIFSSATPAPQPVTFTAIVSGSVGSGAPTGTMAWNTPCMNASTSSTLVASGSSSSAVCIVSASTGTYSVAASYSGDSNYSPVVGYGAATVGDAASIATSWSPNPATYGPLSSTQFSATVSSLSPGGPTPTGTITWAFSSASGAPPACTTASTLSGNPATTTVLTDCSVTFGTAGTYQVTATYSGDNNYSPVTVEPEPVPVS